MRWTAASGAAAAVAFASLLHGALSDPPVGHLKPLGAHRPPSPGLPVVVGFPPAKEFFDKFVKPKQPVILRGASDGWPARAKWTDDYFRRVMGMRAVEIEYSKKEDRSGDGATVTVNEFLDSYDMDGLAAGPVVDLDGAFADDGKDFAKDVGALNNGAPRRKGGKFAGKGGIYLVHEAPPALLRDLWLPPEYLPLMKGIARAPVMWMSSGGTSSVLHNDGDDNLNCVVAGRKVIVLINESREEDVYHGTQWSGYGSRSPVDTSAVDLVRWPRVAEVPWHHVELLPGDCVFMPVSWLHAVRTPPGRSIAVNLWFQPAFAPNWTAAEELRRSLSPALDDPSGGEWEHAPPPGLAAGADQTWQPERAAARRDEAEGAAGSGQAAADDDWQPVTGRLPLSAPEWGFAGGSASASDVSADDLAAFLHRDAMWIDRWLEGAAPSLVPPWGTEPVEIPFWLQSAAKEREERGAEAEEDEDEDDYGEGEDQDED